MMTKQLCPFIFIIFVVVPEPCCTITIRDASVDVHKNARRFQNTHIPVPAYLGDRCQKLEDCIIPRSTCVINKNIWWSGEAFCMCLDGYEPRAGDCVFRNSTEINELLTAFNVSASSGKSPATSKPQLVTSANSGPQSIEPTSEHELVSDDKPEQVPGSVSEPFAPPGSSLTIGTFQAEIVPKRYDTLPSTYDRSQLIPRVDTMSLGERTKTLMNLVVNKGLDNYEQFLTPQSAMNQQISAVSSQDNQFSQAASAQYTLDDILQHRIPQQSSEYFQTAPVTQPRTATLSPIIPDGPDATIPPWMVWVDQEQLKPSTTKAVTAPARIVPMATFSIRTTTLSPVLVLPAATVPRPIFPMTTEAPRPAPMTKASYYSLQTTSAKPKRENDSDNAALRSPEMMLQQEILKQREFIRQQEIAKIIRERLMSSIKGPSLPEANIPEPTVPMTTVPSRPVETTTIKSLDESFNSNHQQSATEEYLQKYRLLEQLQRQQEQFLEQLSTKPSKPVSEQVSEHVSEPVTNRGKATAEEEFIQARPDTNTEPQQPFTPSKKQHSIISPSFLTQLSRPPVIAALPPPTPFQLPAVSLDLEGIFRQAAENVMREYFLSLLANQKQPKITVSGTSSGDIFGALSLKDGDPASSASLPVIAIRKTSSSGEQVKPSAMKLLENDDYAKFRQQLLQLQQQRTATTVRVTTTSEPLTTTDQEPVPETSTTTVRRALFDLIRNPAEIIIGGLNI